MEVHAAPQPAPSPCAIGRGCGASSLHVVGCLLQSGIGTGTVGNAGKYFIFYFGNYYLLFLNQIALFLSEFWEFYLLEIN